MEGNEVTIAFGYYKKVTELVKEQRGLFLDLGKLLSEIKEKKLYKQMGEGGFDSWHQFLANPEIDLSPNIAEVYITVYKFYLLKLNMPREEVMTIPLVRLNTMKAKLEHADEAERGEMIEKAKSLSYGDFMKEMVYHKVATEPKILLSHCEKCGKLKIRYNPKEVCVCGGGIDLDEIK